jgi:hypothetical protein
MGLLAAELFAVCSGSLKIGSCFWETLDSFSVNQFSSYSIINLLKTREALPGTVDHACNPSTWEAETGGLQV